jgi:hypothetical protein
LEDLDVPVMFLWGALDFNAKVREILKGNKFNTSLVDLRSLNMDVK